MHDVVYNLLWTVFIMFLFVFLLSYRGTVSNSRVSMFSVVIVVYEAGDDTFNTIENESE